jgi:hypothetical protein
MLAKQVLFQLSYVPEAATPLIGRGCIVPGPFLLVTSGDDAQNGFACLIAFVRPDSDARRLIHLPEEAASLASNLRDVGPRAAETTENSPGHGGSVLAGMNT